MTEQDLIGAALALGAAEVPGWSRAESALVKRAAPTLTSPARLSELREAIRAGLDPLGDAFSRLRSRDERRQSGATYTPAAVVSAIVEWAAAEGEPARVVDPGLGSGRFAIAAGRRFHHAQIVGVELDPLAAIIGRGGLAAAGLAARASVQVMDYRMFRPERIAGRTAYLGNPPYVRHHDISAEWKRWLTATAQARGLAASRLSGLHVHFLLATATGAQPRDYGAYVTSAEWLDVNYGSLVRELLLDGLGGRSIHVLEPTVAAFEDAATTAAVTCFRIGSQPSSLRMRRVESIDDLGSLSGGVAVPRERLAACRRWTTLTRAVRRVPEGFVELGELCRVHRGAVTGANAVWIVDAPDGDQLFAPELPASVLHPAVTRARELFAAGAVLDSTQKLRRVIDLPRDLDVFDADTRRLIDRFLRSARRRGADSGYIARNRPAWWSVGLRRPAPILASYMARRPPVFVRNPGQARHVNIAHGLYPRLDMPSHVLDRLAAHLRESVTVHDGRTYAGGLTKFEPKEMERLPVPSLTALAE